MKQVFLVCIAAFITISSFAQNKKVSAYKTGQTFKDCTNCPEMVVIPAGSLMMGSPDNEQGRADDPNQGPVEGPQRLVHVSQFAAGKYDITKKQWAEFVKATNHPAGGNCSWANLPG